MVQIYPHLLVSIQMPKIELDFYMHIYSIINCRRNPHRLLVSFCIFLSDGALI